MAQIICPNDILPEVIEEGATKEGWTYQLPEGVEDTCSISATSGQIKFNTGVITPDFEAWIYYINDEGISISSENKIYQNIKVTSPPSFFKVFELYLEDCNGVVATYGLNDLAIGKDNIIIINALVKGEDFNDSFVTKVGYHILGPKTERDKFILSVKDLRATYMEDPLYCTPQEVIDFLGVVDNKGQPMKITEYSTPDYNTIAKRIVEAESIIENTCRVAFTERRVENEIRNADSAWPGTYGYYGILASSGFDYGAQSFFKGCPVKLTKDNVCKIDYSKGDRVEIRRYGSYWNTVPEDMVWQDEAKGIIYVKSLFFQKDASIRVTYRYGKGPVPPAIKRACLLKTALLLMQTQWYVALFPQSPGFDPLKSETTNSWTWEFKDLLRPFSSTICIGGV